MSSHINCHNRLDASLNASKLLTDKIVESQQLSGKLTVAFHDDPNPGSYASINQFCEWTSSAKIKSQFEEAKPSGKTWEAICNDLGNRHICSPLII